MSQLGELVAIHLHDDCHAQRKIHDGIANHVKVTLNFLNEII